MRNCVIMAMWIVCLLTTPEYALAGWAPTTCKASLANYGAISKGMTYMQIVAIVGCEGTLVSNNNLGGRPLTMRRWTGNGGETSSLGVQLWNDKMISKDKPRLK